MSSKFWDVYTKYFGNIDFTILEFNRVHQIPHAMQYWYRDELARDPYDHAGMFPVHGIAYPEHYGRQTRFALYNKEEGFTLIYSDKSASMFWRVSMHGAIYRGDQDFNPSYSWQYVLYYSLVYSRDVCTAVQW